MKLLIALVGAVVALTGCVAVPVGGYADPGYGPGYYYGAPATFSFGYSNHGHSGHGGHGHRRHR